MIFARKLVGSTFRDKMCLVERIRKISVLSSIRKQLQHQKPGCFGVAGLHEPEDWDTIAKSCVRDCLALAESIRAHGRSPKPLVLQQFDDLSDRLCRVLDVAELCRNVHPDPEFVEASNDAYLQISTIIQNLNADYSIYEPLNVLFEQHQKPSKIHGESRYVLSQEDVIMVKSLKEDFERGGISLQQSEKNRLILLQQQINALGSDFMNSDPKTPTTVVLHESKVRSLPGNVKTKFKPVQSNPGYVEVPMSISNAQLLLKWSRDSSIREKAFKSIHDSDGLKTTVLDSILAKRHELAGVLGHSSFANLMFSDRLASSPTDVLEFLENLSKLADKNAMAERLSLERAKLRAEPLSVSGGSTTLHAWDRNFYIGRLKAHSFELLASDVAHYFSLQACLSALTDVVKHVFGIRLMRVNAESTELWHPDVEKLQILDENGEILGHIFLDLYPREGKYPHAAHFAIRCGRQPAEQCDYQTPIVALVCNFGIHSQSGQRLLTMSEYETLFHEFGHSLHSILSRTKYQHLSGTRVSTDLVEVPSHIFEHFAWDPRLVSRYARHYKTGDAMPTRTVKSLCASRRGFAATDLQMQVLFSAMDLRFHGEHPPIGATTACFEQLQKTLTVMEPDVGVAVPSTFHHFIGYAAGYYSYVFARILSAQIWADLFEEDPFSRQSGDKLRHRLLTFGASREASSLVENIVSKDVTCKAFLKSLNIEATSDPAKLRLPLSRTS